MILEILVLYPFIFAIFIILSLWAAVCHNHITSAVLTIVAGISAYLSFGIQLSSLLTFAYAFIPVGLLWSVWRWKRYCSDSVETALKHKNDPDYGAQELQRSRLAARVDLARNVDKVIPWIIGWPTSMIAHFLGDFIKLLKTMVTEWFSKIYTKFSNDALAKFDK